MSDYPAAFEHGRDLHRAGQPLPDQAMTDLDVLAGYLSAESGADGYISSNGAMEAVSSLAMAAEQHGLVNAEAVVRRAATLLAHDTDVADRVAEELDREFDQD